MIFKSLFKKKEANSPQVSEAKRRAPQATAEEISQLFISTLLEQNVQNEHNSIGNTNELDDKLVAKVMAELTNFNPDTIPKIANASLELMEALIDENVCSSKIVATVKEDPVLLGKLLHLANSAFYRCSKTEIESIDDAVIMMGNDEIRKLVISTLMVDNLKINSVYFRFFGANIWQHSHDVATMAALYASSKGMNEFQAYLNGLLHDVGKLVIFKLLIDVLETEAPGTYPSKSFFIDIMDRYSHKFTLMALKEWALNPDWIRPILTYQSKVKLESMDLNSQALYISNYCSELTRLRQSKLIDDEELSRQLYSKGIELDIYKELINKL
ncbi:HDOD domain-containing protein [Neptuniibacter sp. QD29_5]|uniref:HDOD domain-containing protein n=1 Tax=Neptuniibacter sp. QD29_5 TaxID=3398207 RepID=UPI0039F4896C